MFIDLEDKPEKATKKQLLKQHEIKSMKLSESS